MVLGQKVDDLSNVNLQLLSSSLHKASVLSKQNTNNSVPSTSTKRNTTKVKVTLFFLSVDGFQTLHRPTLLPIAFFGGKEYDATTG